MSKSDLEFNKFKTKGSIVPFIVVAVIIFILVFLMRNCNSPNEFWNGIHPENNQVQPFFPENPNTLQPIDTTKIVVPNDPLKRPILSNLLNVYVQDTTNLKKFSIDVINKFINDSIKVTYYAEAYKRVQFKVPTTRQTELKRSIKENFNHVKFVCYESILSTNQTRTDPGFNNPDYTWFYDQIGLFDAWDRTMGDPKIKIAVLDDSFDPNHKEIINRMENPWNVFEYSNSIKTYNKFNHGTHVAGTVVGEINNGLGISGVAPKCKLIPIQIANSHGKITTSSVLDGIFYALKNGADVINMSFGIDLSHAFGNISEDQQKMYAKTLYVDEEAMWNEVFEIASKEGVVIVQAAGNSSAIAALDPMKRSEIAIVVGATDRNKKVAEFSNYGNEVDIYAPGVGIYSAVPNQNFKMMDGTSMSSPIVAGCVALIKSINNQLSTAEIKQMINDSAEDLEGGNKFIQINQILLKIQAL